MRQERLNELKKIVANSYELTADHFNQTRSKIAAADFQWAASLINSTDKVFDTGCGNGRLLDYIKIQPENYLGLDQSQKLIDLACQQHSGYDFKQGELTNIDNFPEAFSSVIFCSAVISHIPGRESREAVLHSFLNLSQPDGRLIISFWKMGKKYRRQLRLNLWKKITGRHPYSWRDLIFPWKDSSGREISSRYYHCFSKRSFRREISAAGWKIESENDDKFNYWLVARKEK